MDYEKLLNCFLYLDALRRSGATNMFGAGAYLKRDMELDSRTAKKVHIKWMETFSEGVPVEERASRAYQSFVN